MGRQVGALVVGVLVGALVGFWWCSGDVGIRMYGVTLRKLNTPVHALAAELLLHPTSLQNDHQITLGCERSRRIRSRRSC